MCFSKYKVSAEWIKEPGDEASFLKRKHILVHPDLLVIQPNPKYVEKLMQVTGLSVSKAKHKTTPLPTGPLPTDSEHDPPLDSETSGKYRSAIGILMYIQADLLECQYAVRFLSTVAHCPTEGGWKLLRHLTSYVHGTQNHVLGLATPTVGSGIVRQGVPNGSVLEIFRTQTGLVARRPEGV